MQTKPSNLARLLSLNAEAVNGFTNKDVPGFEVYRAVIDAYEKSCADYAGETWAENVEAERLKYEGSLFEFFKRAWQEFDPSPLKVGAHHWLICKHLEAISHGEFTANGYRKFLANVPPRCTKSNLVNVCWLAWMWAQRDIGPLSGPQVRFLAISYGDRLSKDIARTSRRLILSEWYQQMWGHQVKILDDQSGIDNYGNTAGGSRIATSMSGATLGRGGDIRCLDDPHKIEEAESEDERQRIVRTYDEALSTRDTDPSTSVEVCIMQRIHESDISGHILSTSTDDLVHLCLPMRYDPERHCQTPWGEDWRTEDGELLWPEQFPADIVDQRERRMGPYAFAGQYQQIPAPRGGGIIEKEFWQVWPEVPPPLGQPVQLPDVSFVLVSLDTAISEEEQASYNACTVWGIWHRAPNAPRTQRVTDSGADLRGVFADRAGMVERAFLIPEWVGRLPQSEQDEWLKQRREKTLRYTPTNYAHDLRDEEQPRIILMEAWRRRCRLHDPTLGPDGQPKGLVERVLDTARRRHANALVIENKTRGKDVQQELQRMMRAAEFGVHLFEPRKHGDKVSRLLSVQPLFTGGLVYAPVAYDPVTGEQQEFRWCQSVISEIAQVPKGQFNDLADSCFVAGTLIATRMGDVPIERIEVGDEVLTPAGFRRVTAAGCTGVMPTISRLGLTGTASHPVFTLDQGYMGLDTISQAVMLSRLSLCGLIRLILRSGSPSRVSPITSWSKRTAQPNTGYPSAADPEIPEGQSASTLPFGNRIMAALLRRDMRSTTRTATRLTVTLITWSVYRRACISNFLSGAIKTATSKFLTRIGRRQRSGIDRRLVGSGIDNTPTTASTGQTLLSHFQRKQILKSSVSGAARGREPSTWGRNFAGRLVRSLRAGFAEESRRNLLTIMLERAGFSEPQLAAVGAGKVTAELVSDTSSALARAGKPVHVTVMAGSPRFTRIMLPVYNLAVDEAECYYANGILVHNCAQALIWLREAGLILLTEEHIQEQLESRAFRPKRESVVQHYGV